MNCACSSSPPQGWLCLPSRVVSGVQGQVAAGLLRTFTPLHSTSPHGSSHPRQVFAGLLVGAMLPYWFSAMTMKSVGKVRTLQAAFKLVNLCMPLIDWSAGAARCHEARPQGAQPASEWLCPPGSLADGVTSLQAARAMVATGAQPVQHLRRTLTPLARRCCAATLGAGRAGHG